MFKKTLALSSIALLGMVSIVGCTQQDQGKSDSSAETNATSPIEGVSQERYDDLMKNAEKSLAEQKKEAEKAAEAQKKADKKRADDFAKRSKETREKANEKIQPDESVTKGDQKKVKE